jgi:hypothetical protein
VNADAAVPEGKLVTMDIPVHLVVEGRVGTTNVDVDRDAAPIDAGVSVMQGITVGRIVVLGKVTVIVIGVVAVIAAEVVSVI